MRKKLGFGVGALRKLFFEHSRDPRVQRLSAALEQRIVGCVLYQCVLERVARFGRGALAESKPRFGQLVKGDVEVGLTLGCDRCDQFIAEFTSDGRADLRDLLDRREPIQPRHQQVAQGCRNGDVAGGADIVVTIAGVRKFARLENRLGELFQIQGYAVGLGQDALQQIVGERPPAGESGHDFAALRARELGQIEGPDVAVTTPPGLELEPVREHDQQRHGSDPIE